MNKFQLWKAVPKRNAAGGGALQLLLAPLDNPSRPSGPTQFETRLARPAGEHNLGDPIFQNSSLLGIE